jgi:hypothetical protein
MARRKSKATGGGSDPSPVSIVPRRLSELSTKDPVFRLAIREALQETARSVDASMGLGRLLDVARGRYPNLDDVELLFLMSEKQPPETISINFQFLALLADPESALAYKAALYAAMWKYTSEASRAARRSLKQQSGLIATRTPKRSTRDYAVFLYTSGQWKSKADFIKKNEQLILEHAKQLGWTMSQQRFSATCADWLRGGPKSEKH